MRMENIVYVLCFMNLQSKNPSRFFPNHDSKFLQFSKIPQKEPQGTQNYKNFVGGKLIER